LGVGGFTHQNSGLTHQNTGVTHQNSSTTHQNNGFTYLPIRIVGLNFEVPLFSKKNLNIWRGNNNTEIVGIVHMDLTLSLSLSLSNTRTHKAKTDQFQIFKMRIVQKIVFRN
jgi:hypothetical protein